MTTNFFQRKVTTKSEVEAIFRETVVPLLKERRTVSTVSSAWSAFLEALCDDGRISEGQYELWTSPGEGYEESEFEDSVRAAEKARVTFSHDERAMLADRMNEMARGARHGAPRLAADSSRSTLIRWAKWNDGNGAFSDEDCRAEGSEPLTAQELWEILETVALGG